MCYNLDMGALCRDPKATHNLGVLVPQFVGSSVHGPIVTHYLWLTPSRGPLVTNNLWITLAREWGVGIGVVGNGEVVVGDVCPEAELRLVAKLIDTWIGAPVQGDYREGAVHIPSVALEHLDLANCVERHQCIAHDIGLPEQYPNPRLSTCWRLTPSTDLSSAFIASEEASARERKEPGLNAVLQLRRR